MKRVSLYSSSGRTPSAARTVLSSPPDGSRAQGESPKGAPGEAPSAAASRRPGLWRRSHQRYRAPLLVASGGLVTLLLVLAYGVVTPLPRQVTQDDVNAAVLHVLETTTLPSPAARAYEIIRPSVVRVRGLSPGVTPEDVVQTSVGTGVIVVDSGMILTNLHVIDGATSIGITFADGSESEATVVGARPEHDLAVLRPRVLPDDVVAATLRSTGDLKLGDDVIAVGFPFGIGPSVSSGVVSGLKREYYSMEGRSLLTNLIQFDAAANPGSSGGPLVTAEGEVVGIVTSILNPTNESFFVGIGFAVPIENAAAAVGAPPF